MRNIGFIGLGIMGKPMAKNLLRAAGALLVYDLDQAAAADLVACGAEAATPSEMAERCDILFLSLPDGQIVDAVLFGEAGIAAKLRPGALICDMTTTELAETR